MLIPEEEKMGQQSPKNEQGQGFSVSEGGSER